MGERIRLWECDRWSQHRLNSRYLRVEGTTLVPRAVSAWYCRFLATFPLVTPITRPFEPLAYVTQVHSDLIRCYGIGFYDSLMPEGLFLRRRPWL